MFQMKERFHPRMSRRHANKMHQNEHNTFGILFFSWTNSLTRNSIEADRVFIIKFLHSEMKCDEESRLPSNELNGKVVLYSPFLDWTYKHLLLSG